MLFWLVRGCAVGIKNVSLRDCILSCQFEIMTMAFVFADFIFVAKWIAILFTFFSCLGGLVGLLGYLSLPLIFA